MIHLDTQVVIWLYQRKRNRLGADAERLIKRNRNLVISPLVIVELEILLEAGRIAIPSVDAVLADVGDQFSIEASKASLQAVTQAARSFAWTRDPFDRLIVANAMADNARLVTADTHIQANFKDAVW